MPTATSIPTEPIGSIPRPQELIEALASKGMDDPVEPAELIATVASVVGRTGEPLGS